MGPHYSALLDRLTTLNDIEKATAVLYWDRETNMPVEGGATRTRQIATLSQLAHDMFTSAQTGDLLSKAEEELRDTAHEETPACMLRSVRRDYDEQIRFPSEFVRRRSEVTGAAGIAWASAREQNNFSAFQPHLEQAVLIGQESAAILGYEKEPYDALLDTYERGMTTSAVREIFDTVKVHTVPLIQAIADHAERVDDRILTQQFPVETQRAMCRYAAQAIGYDFSRGHLGEVHHPFSTSFGRNDVRITTRFAPEFAMSSLFATLHEAGHAMYEQGVAEELDGTPLGKGTSSGIHESQSRLFENQVGRSRGFWMQHFDALQHFFPAQLANVTAENFYRAINKVKPSLIRVEADELTYNMHIILRFELEQSLIDGSVRVSDLREAWQEKIRELLGITPTTDRQGVLQDVHWSQAAFGYFPTYTLGNLYAAQFMHAAKRQDPQIHVELASGNTQRLREWLRVNVHQHGSKFDAPELCVKATGEPLTAAPFIAYVGDKFGELYRL